MSRYTLKNSRFHHGDDGDAELTNLIDPVMVLIGLLAAMVVLLPTFSQVRSTLTEADGARADVAQNEAIVLSFSKEGQIHWRDEPINLPELCKRVEIMTADDGSTPCTVFLAGDEKAP